MKNLHEKFTRVYYAFLLVTLPQHLLSLAEDII